MTLKKLLKIIFFSRLFLTNFVKKSIYRNLRVYYYFNKDKFFIIQINYYLKKQQIKYLKLTYYKILYLICMSYNFIILRLLIIDK